MTSSWLMVAWAVFGYWRVIAFANDSSSLQQTDASSYAPRSSPEPPICNSNSGSTHDLTDCLVQCIAIGPLRSHHGDWNQNVAISQEPLYHHHGDGFCGFCANNRPITPVPHREGGWRHLRPPTLRCQPQRKNDFAP